MKAKAKPHSAPEGSKFKPANKIKASLCQHTTDSRFALITTAGNSVLCVLCGTTWSPDQ